MIVIEACVIAQMGLNTLLSKHFEPFHLFPTLGEAVQSEVFASTNLLVVGPSFGDAGALQIAREVGQSRKVEGLREIGIIMFTPNAINDVLLEDAARSGVSLCVATPVLAVSDLIAQVCQVRDGRNLIPLTALQRATPIEALSVRELEVLRLAAAHFSNREIAAQLNMAIDTANSHIKNILAKLQVSNRREAIYRARHLGWLS